jgi:hypothetical protein
LEQYRAAAIFIVDGALSVSQTVYSTGAIVTLGSVFRFGLYGDLFKCRLGNQGLSSQLTGQFTLKILAILLKFWLWRLLIGIGYISDP